MSIINIATAITKISVNEIRDFIFENYFKRMAFSKKHDYHSMKCLEKKKIYCCLQIN